MTSTATPDATGTGPQRVVPSRRRRRIRPIRVALITVSTLVTVIIVAGLPLYVFPPQGDATGANLVYVIGPPRQPRLEYAEKLRANDHGLPALVSVSDTNKGHGAKAFDASSLDFCDEQGVTCRTPSPFTTKGEAKMLTEYAKTHKVGKTVVITFTPHVARTRYIFAKCYGGDVTVIGVDEHLSLFDWIYQYVYQTAAFIKAWATPCS